MNASQRICAIAISILCSGGALATGQNLREVARERGRQNPGAVLQHTAPPAEYLSKSIEDIAREADAVVQGRLVATRSYLGANADRVLTDYRIVDPAIITGALPALSAATPGISTSLVLTVLGGDVTIEGVRIRSTDNNRAAIEDGGSYVVALKKSRAGEPGHYEIYSGAIFEVRDGRVTALIKQADRVFKGTVDSDASRLTARLRAAKKDLQSVQAPCGDFCRVVRCARKQTRRLCATAVVPSGSPHRLAFTLTSSQYGDLFQKTHD